MTNRIARGVSWLFAATWMFGGVAAQQKPGSQSGVLDSVREAEALLQKGEKERAAQLLRSCRSRTGEVPDTMRRAIEDSIAAMLERADPHGADLKSAEQRAADAFLDLAKTYRVRKWYRTSLRMVREAERYDGSRIGEALHSLKVMAPRLFAKTTPAPVASSEAAGPRDQLADAVIRDEYAQGWKITKQTITSPRVPDKPSSNLALLFDKPTHGDGEVGIDVKWSDAEGQVGMLFGATDYNEYFMYYIDYYGDGRGIATVSSWSGEVFKKLSSVEFHSPKVFKDRWNRLAVRVDGTTATLLLAGETVHTVTLPSAPRGRIGLTIGVAAPGKSPVEFRGLQVKSPAELAREKAQAAAARLRAKEDPHQRAATEQIAAAEDSLNAKQPEEAFLAVLEAGPHVPRVRSAAVRSALQQSILTLCKRSNRVFKQHRDAYTKAAKALLGAANSYTAGGWHTTARELLVRARELDAEVPTAALAANDKAMEPILAKLHGHRPEPQVAADTEQITKWFQGGREPYGKAGWTFDAVSARPTSQPSRRSGAVLLSTRKVGKAANVTLQIKTGDVVSTAGVVFGAKSKFHYHLLTIDHEPKLRATFVQVYKWNGSEHLKVGPQLQLRFTPEARAQWMTLGLAFDDQKVVVRLGREPAKTLPLKGQDFSGSLGLYTTLRPGSTAVEFRNLTIEEPKQ
ncbi:MAG: DUF1080 domain-containing protein [Planctomycetes bacterium]|nr:DUF1080 domain-containing protein [Planctomycetota bacterium]